MINEKLLLIAKCAYRMGRKDAARYARRSAGAAHVDSQTVDRIASLIWNSTRGDVEADPFEVIGPRLQTKMRVTAQVALAAVGEAMMRALEEAPPDPVSFEAIVSAAAME